MSQDFETLPIGTEDALRNVVRILTDAIGGLDLIMFTSEERDIESALAILAQIDAQRKGATDARN